MRYFGNRRPRGFHYTYRFSNERRDLLDSLRRGIAPEELAERSLNSDAAENGCSRRRSSFGLSVWVSAIAMLLLLALCLLLVLS